MNALILERFPRFGRLAIAVAVAGAPAVFLPVSLDVFNLAKLTLIWTAGLAAGWFWYAWSLEERVKIPRFSLGYAAAAFLAAYLLATVFSQNRVVSILGLQHRYGGFVAAAVYAGIALMIVALNWQRPGGLRTIAAAIVAGSVPVSAYALIQAADLDWIAWSTLGGAPPAFPGSTLGNSNFLGGYLGIALPFLTYFVFTSKHRFFQVLTALILAAAAASIWISGSRGGLLAAAGGLLVMAVVYRDRLTGAMKALIAFIVILGLAIAVVTLWHPGMHAPPRPAQELDVLRTDTFRLRSHYWAAAWRIFLDNPILGTGPDTFKENYKSYHLALSAQDLAAGTPDKPHNIFLEYAANSGVLGLGTYLTLIVLALKYAARRAKSEAGPERALLGAFLGGLAAYLIQGLFSIDIPPLALMGWTCLAGIAVLADPKLLALRKEMTAPKKGSSKQQEGGKKSNDKRAQDQISTRSRRTKQVAGAGLAVAMVAVGVRPLLADLTARAAMSGAKTLPDALDMLKRADELHPWDGSYLTMATTRVFRQARLSPPGRQIDVFRKGHLWLIETGRQDPRSMFAAMNLARLNEFWAARHDPERYRVADSWWARAVALDPSDWRLRLKYGGFLGDWALETDDVEVKHKTVDVLEKAAELKPEEPQVWFALGKAFVLNADHPRARIAFQQALTLRPEYNEARIWLKRVSSRSRP